MDSINEAFDVPVHCILNDGKTTFDFPRIAIEDYGVWLGEIKKNDSALGRQHINEIGITDAATKFDILQLVDRRKPALSVIANECYNSDGAMRVLRMSFAKTKGIDFTKFDKATYDAIKDEATALVRKVRGYELIETAMQVSGLFPPPKKTPAPADKPNLGETQNQIPTDDPSTQEIGSSNVL